MPDEDAEWGEGELANEGLFLKALFRGLDEASVRYAVMRNFELLPDNAGGSDLDVLVDPADEARLRTVLAEALRVADGAVIGVANSIGFFKAYALGKSTRSAYPWWGLRVDFNIGLRYRGNSLLNESIAWPVRQHRGIPVLARGFSAVLGVLKDVMNNGTVPSRYVVAARVAAKEEWSQIEALLSPMGKIALGTFREMLLSSESLESLGGQCTALRREVARCQLGLAGFQYVRLCAAFEWSRVRRYLRPPGMVVAILGADGAGKSTVIGSILPVLNSATHNAIVVRHLRPNLLPPLARLKGKTQQPGAPVREPHGSTQSGWFGSLFRLAYLTLDYVIGYWLWTRPIIAKQPTIVLFDRYAYDLVLDPRRFRIRLPEWMNGMFIALAPKPDLVVCLHGDPETLSRRKGELSLDETRRQIEAMTSLARKLPQAILVSTDCELNKTRDEVLGALLSRLRERQKDRERSSDG